MAREARSAINAIRGELKHFFESQKLDDFLKVWVGGWVGGSRSGLGHVAVLRVGGGWGGH